MNTQQLPEDIRREDLRKKIKQQSATISELLQELQNIKDNPNARRNTFRKEIGQLLQKHKP